MLGNDGISAFNCDNVLAVMANKERAYFGSAPTMQTLKEAYGNAAVIFLITGHLNCVNEHSGKRPMDGKMMSDLAYIIQSKTSFLKATELQLFFGKLRSAEYGQFYGQVDPDTILRALTRFIDDRNAVHMRKQSEEHAKEFEKWRKNAMTHEDAKQTKEYKEAYKKELQRLKQTMS